VAGCASEEDACLYLNTFSFAAAGWLQPPTISYPCFIQSPYCCCYISVYGC